MYIRVQATPRAKREQVIFDAPDQYRIFVKEPAERNLANTRIRELLARECQVSLHSVRLISGHRSPSKIFSIPDDA